MERPTGLFVYGTLKHGGSNFYLVEHLVTAALRGWYLFGQLYNAGSYPGLIVPGERKIRGELLVSDSPDDLLRITDALEGDEYRRVLAEILHADHAGTARLAWVYVYARDTSQLERLDIDEWPVTGSSVGS